jgi:hypothetical protein
MTLLYQHISGQARRDVAGQVGGLQYDRSATYRLCGGVGDSGAAHARRTQADVDAVTEVQLITIRATCPNTRF